MANNIKFNAEQALRLAGEYLVGKAKANLASGSLKHPTGILLNSVEYWFEGDTLCVGTKIGYGAYLELGTGLFAANGDGRKTPWTYYSDEGYMYQPRPTKNNPDPAPEKVHWVTTSGQHPNPWLRPALEENKDKVKQLIINNLEINK